jgi:hypothetical protein
MARTAPSVLAAVAVLLAAGGLSACESSQTKSARLEKTGKAKAQTTLISAGAANTSVKVLSKAILHSENGNAVVLQLQNTGGTGELQVPLLLTVKDAKGGVTYKNDIKGLQPSLQEMAYLDKGQTSYWVNDQVLAVDPPKSVEVEVGKEKSTFAGTVPKITLGPITLKSDSTGSYASGEVKNESKILQLNVPVFAVALKGEKVVAAGRAIVEKLPPAPTPKPINFKIYFIGDPKGAALKLTTAPTVLQEGQPPS